MHPPFSIGSSSSHPPCDETLQALQHHGRSVSNHEHLRERRSKQKKSPAARAGPSFPYVRAFSRRHARVERNAGEFGCHDAALPLRCSASLRAATMALSPQAKSSGSFPVTPSRPAGLLSCANGKSVPQCPVFGRLLPLQSEASSTHHKGERILTRGNGI